MAFLAALQASGASISTTDIINDKRVRLEPFEIALKTAQSQLTALENENKAAQAEYQNAKEKIKAAAIQEKQKICAAFATNTGVRDSATIAQEAKKIETERDTAKKSLEIIHANVQEIIVALRTNWNPEVPTVIVDFLFATQHNKSPAINISQLATTNLTKLILTNTTTESASAQYKHLCSQLGQYLLVTAAKSSDLNTIAGALMLLILGDDPENNRFMIECYHRLLVDSLIFLCGSRKFRRKLFRTSLTRRFTKSAT